MSRPTLKFLGAETTSVRITRAFVHNANKELVETLDESTTGNRRPQYEVVCKTCLFRFLVPKRTIVTSFRCQGCKKTLSAYQLADSNAEQEFLGQVLADKGSIYTIFALGRTYTLVKASGREAEALLQLEKPEFFARWRESEKIKYLMPKGVVISPNRTTYYGEREMSDLSFEYSEEARLHRILAGEPLPTPQVSGLKALEGWHDDLPALAQEHNLLAVSVFHKAGWLVSQTSRDVIKQGGTIEKFKGIVFDLETVAFYAKDGVDNFYYVHQDTSTLPTEGFFG